MKNKILKIAETVLLAITFPLWFMKIFVDIGYLPDQAGDVVRVVFRHSMYENICDGAHPCLVYIAMAVIISAIVLNMVALGSDNKKIQSVSRICFGVAIGIFIVLLLYASMVARCY